MTLSPDLQIVNNTTAKEELEVILGEREISPKVYACTCNEK